MGLFRRALSSQLSKYRKRKTISLDGTVGGMNTGFAGPRHYAQAQDGWLGMLPTGSHHSVYDAQAHYHHSNREYEEPPEWFVGARTSGCSSLSIVSVLSQISRTAALRNSESKSHFQSEIHCPARLGHCLPRTLDESQIPLTRFLSWLLTVLFTALPSGALNPALSLNDAQLNSQ